jgi:hypothetical protein
MQQLVYRRDMNALCFEIVNDPRLVQCRLAGQTPAHQHGLQVVRTLKQAHPYLISESISESCQRYVPTRRAASEFEAHNDLHRLMGPTPQTPRNVSASTAVDCEFIAPPALICCRLAQLECAL